MISSKGLAGTTTPYIHSVSYYSICFGTKLLTMEAARTPETLVNFYQIKRRYNPEDSHLRTHRRENLKSF
jgi:hypothetical protein